MKKNTKTLTLLTTLSFLIVMFATVTINAKCYKEHCFRLPPGPITVQDFSQPFNEKRYWIEENDRTGEPQICYQRLFLYPEYFRSPEIRCFPAQKLEQTSTINNGNTCWYANNMVLCQKNNGELYVHSKARKMCTAEPKRGTVLGYVKNSRRAQRRGEAKRCAITIVTEKPKTRLSS